MTEQEKLAFELEIRQKAAEENRARQREYNARWRKKIASICVIMNALVGRERKCARR